VERGTRDAPLRALVTGPKRHVEWIDRPEGPLVVNHAEVALGGFFVDPPSMIGRAVGSTHREWSSSAVRRELLMALMTDAGRSEPRPIAPWEETK